MTGLPRGCSAFAKYGFMQSSPGLVTWTMSFTGQGQGVGMLIDGSNHVELLPVSSVPQLFPKSTSI